MDNIGILLATINPAKQNKLRWLLDGIPLTPVVPDEVGLGREPAPEEAGSSHEQNARLKAESWSKAASGLAVSSDGGLVIPSLGRRWESILTHRFAGEGADDNTRLQRLLQIMQPYRGEERKASWVEALAIADNGKTLASWTVDGATGLLLEALDSRPIVPGFWVFSVWFFPKLGKTYNELDDSELEQLNDHWSQLKTLARRFFLKDTKV